MVCVPADYKQFWITKIPAINGCSDHTSTESDEKHAHENISAASIPDRSTAQVFGKLQVLNLHHMSLKHVLRLFGLSKSDEFVFGAELLPLK